MGIHDGCWKLITNKELNRTELYDLQDDWPEKKEVSVDYPEVVEELTKKLYAWKESLPVVPNKSCISKSR